MIKAREVSYFLLRVNRASLHTHISLTVSTKVLSAGILLLRFGDTSTHVSYWESILNSPHSSWRSWRLPIWKPQGNCIPYFFYYTDYPYSQFLSIHIIFNWREHLTSQRRVKKIFKYVATVINVKTNKRTVSKEGLYSFQELFTPGAFRSLALTWLGGLCSACNSRRWWRHSLAWNTWTSKGHLNGTCFVLTLVTDDDNVLHAIKSFQESLQEKALCNFYLFFF